MSSSSQAPVAFTSGVGVPSRAATSLRVTGIAALMTIKILLRARIVVVAAVVQPAVYAAIAGFVLRHHSTPPPLSAALGVAIMNAWTAILFFAGGLLVRERRQGTLEMLVAAPSSLAQVMFGACLAVATIALYAMVSAVAVTAVFFGTPVRVAHPAEFVLAIIVAIAVLAIFGLSLAAFFILFRNAVLFQNALEFPVWIASGLLVPLAVLPWPVRIIGWALPPTWANEALSRAASGSGSEVAALGGAALTGAAYLVVGVIFVKVAERRAQVDATLRLS